MKITVLSLILFFSFNVQAYEMPPQVIKIKNPIQVGSTFAGLPKDICVSAVCQPTATTNSIQNILNSMKKKKGLSSLDYTGPCTPGKGFRPRQVCPRDPNESCPPAECEPDPQCS